MLKGERNMKKNLLICLLQLAFIGSLYIAITGCIDEPEDSLNYIGEGIKDVLKNKLSIHSIDVSSSPVEDKDGVGWGNAPHPQIILKVRQDNSMAIAWNDENGTVHISDITGDYQLTGSDIVFDNTDLGGFAITPTGYGLTAVRDSMLFIVGVNRDGSVKFETQLIGIKPHTEKGSKFDPMAFGSSRLHYANNRYASYFSHQQNFSDNPDDPNIHQGDMLVFLDTGGNKMVDSGGWNWGTSHSLDERLDYDGEVFVTVSLGDAYPKGITFQRVTKFKKKTILELDANMSGWANGDLGGLVILDAIYAVAFLTPQWRDTTDVGVLFVNADGELTNLIWMTASRRNTGRYINRANAARYGEDILIAWNVYNKDERTDIPFIATITSNGQIVYGPDQINVTFNIGDDFVTFPNGDTGWAIAEDGKLKIVRVAL
jgi:hypothetical protein